MKLPGRDYAGIAFFTVILGALPLILRNPYYVNVMVFVGINTIIILGLNLLTGYAGQISLGHAAFYALGAYSSAILTATYGLPPLVALAASLLVVAGVAFLVGGPTLRLKGHYLAMATLGFGIIIQIFAMEATPLTNGPSGIFGIPKLAIGGFVFNNDLKFYYLVWSFIVIFQVCIVNMVRSKIGRALLAIHSNERAAEALGIDASSHKLTIFVLSAVLAGLAGSLYAHFINFISPETFGFGFSVTLVTMVIVGGMGSIWGPPIGAFALTALPEILRTVKDYDIMVYGLLLILMVMFMPKGLAGGMDELLHAVLRKRKPGVSGWEVQS